MYIGHKLILVVFESGLMSWLVWYSLKDQGAGEVIESVSFLIQDTDLAQAFFLCGDDSL